MKRNTDDIEFANLLKQNTPEASQNPWFTRKVMNRLPEKSQPTFVWGSILVSILCVLATVAAWYIFFSKHSLNVVTVRDIVTFAFMACTTLAFALIPVVNIFRKNENF